MLCLLTGFLSGWSRLEHSFGGQNIDLVLCLLTGVAEVGQNIALDAVLTDRISVWLG